MVLPSVQKWINTEENVKFSGAARRKLKVIREKRIKVRKFWEKNKNIYT